MNIFRLSCAMLCCALIIACNNSDEIEGDLGGEIIGFVYVADNNNSYLEDKSGVSVSLSHGGQSQTNPGGKYALSQTHPGNYDIIFSKDGYGSFRKENFVFIGGEKPAVIPHETICKFPEVTLKDITINTRFISSGMLGIKAKVDTELSSAFTFKVYGDLQAEVNNVDYSKTAQTAYLSGGSRDEISLTFHLDDKLSNAKAIYLAFYARNTLDHGVHYKDPKQPLVFPTEKPCWKEVIKIVLP